MKFCYADPPYFGNGKSKYGYPEWDTKERHIELVRQLTKETGRVRLPDGLWKVFVLHHTAWGRS